MAQKKLSQAEALKQLNRVRAEVAADEELAKAALDIVSNYYWASVRSTAADYLERAHAGEFKSEDELEDDLRNHVDGNEWVIYTYWARICVLMSNNADAWEEEMGEPPKDDAQRAYGALMQDIRNHPDFEEALGIARGEDE